MKAKRISPPEPINLPRMPRLDEIRDLTAQICGIDAKDLREPNPSRHPRLVIGRQLYVYLCRRTTFLSYPLIRESMGYPSGGHSAQIDQFNKITKRMKDETDRVWAYREFVAVSDLVQLAESELYRMTGGR